MKGRRNKAKAAFTTEKSGGTRDYFCTPKGTVVSLWADGEYAEIEGRTGPVDPVYGHAYLKPNTI